MPVLPAVPSTTVPPGHEQPAPLGVQHDGARRTVLDRTPGFMNSALPRISQPVLSLARRNRISGVWPMASQ